MRTLEDLAEIAEQAGMQLRNQGLSGKEREIVAHIMQMAEQAGILGVTVVKTMEKMDMLK